MESNHHGRPARLFGVGAALALLSGVLGVHLLPVLPPAGVAAAVLLGAMAACRWPKARTVALVLVGFGWCALRAHLAMDARLPRDLEGRDFTITARIDQLPLQRTDATRLTLRLEDVALDGQPFDLRGRVRMSWYTDAPQDLDACSRWHLQVRLKRPRGLVNRGGFDSERQALERDIVAVGYVRESPVNRRIGEQAFCFNRVRERISRAITATVADPHDAALLRAFAVGDTRGLDQDDWEVARANGIPHLIAISGFHVGVAAGFGALLVYALWWLWPSLGLRVAFPVAQAPAALVTAILYGFLAGGSLPTVRTVSMIAVVTLTRFGRRASSGPHALALALFAIIAFDPLATLSAGFWLSFVGVAFLMACLTRSGRGVRAFLRELSVGQIVMTVSLLPMTVWFFGQASLVGALSNLIAVPVISFIIVPLCLLGIVTLLAVPVVAPPLLIAAGWVAHAQWWLLERLATWPGAHWYLPEVTPWAMLLATLGALWLFLPRGVPMRPLGLLLFLPLLWPDRPPPPTGAFEAVVIDVGQGLSVMVRTHAHALLFDAGAKYPSDFDLGDAAVLPTLRSFGVGGLDVLMVSHGDNDHAGGAPVVAAAYPDAKRLAGEPARMTITTAQCRAGMQWRWDDVTFRLVNPDVERFDAAATAAADNDRSCVLVVGSAAGRLLLTGDISSRVEAEVARAVGPGPPLVLVVPHHGSKSSSDARFIAAVAPTEALVSAGWRNRFGHPDPLVVARYADAPVPLVNTAEAGAVHVDFPRDAPPRIVSRERERQHRYWRE